MKLGVSLWPVVLCGLSCPVSASSALSDIVKDLNIRQATSETSDTRTPASLVRRVDYNGWKNPEDYDPMPLCAYYVDNGKAWLDMMMGCTEHLCTTSCSHYQWLTEQSCLEANAIPALLKPYYDNCGRNPLGKALLYEWLGKTLGSGWQSPPEDVLTAEHPSTKEMKIGYKGFGVKDYAPSCLLGMHLDKHDESFNHAMEVCSFKPTTGNISTGILSPNGKDWAYDYDGYMVTTTVQVPGYDIFGDGKVAEGKWFDNACFCDSLSEEKEPCMGANIRDLTRERLWLNATCPGNKILPDHWQDGLFIVNSSHKILGDITWPSCFDDQKQPPNCQGSYSSALASCRGACVVNAPGYCENIPDIAGADCFCKSVSYDACGGSCHIFDGRMNYINWMEDICGGVEGWKGLPQNWTTDIFATSKDLIPWSWRVSPSDGMSTTSKTRSISESKCPSTSAKLGSFAEVSVVSVIVVLIFARRDIIKYVAGDKIVRPLVYYWWAAGFIIAMLQVVSNLVNAAIVSNTSGYEDVPVGKLMLLWCTRPRLAWMAVVLMKVQEDRLAYIPIAASLLFSEVLLQLPSVYYMVLTANYARLHKLYGHILDRSSLKSAALTMYAGALIWLILVGFGIVAMLWSLSGVKSRIKAVHEYERQEYNRSREMYATEPRSLHRQRIVRVEEMGKPVQAYIRGGGDETERGGKHPRQRIAADRRWQDEKHPRIARAEELPAYDGYATSIPVDDERHIDDRQPEDSIQAKRLNPTLVLIVCILMTLVWIAQWLFWAGFVELAADEFCVPKLGSITGVWIVFSIVGIIFGASFGHKW